MSNFYISPAPTDIDTIEFSTQGIAPLFVILISPFLSSLRAYFLNN